MKLRNPSIELYRVILMLLIVLHHAAYHGCWNHAQGLDVAWPSIYLIFTASIAWHVDGFIAITGWFGTKFSLSRFAKLWGVIAFYSVLSVAYGCWINGRISAAYLAGGWFGQTYLYFLFLTPVLNAAIEELCERGGKYMCLSWIIFDVAVVLNWAPYHLLTGVAGGGTDGCSAMMFIVLYVNVRLLKMSGLDRFFTKKVIAFCCLLFLGLSVAIRVDSGYNAPHVVLMGIAGLISFEKFIKIPDSFAKVICAISPLMFGIYVCHATTSFGSQLYVIPQEWLNKNFDWHPSFVIVVSSMACFSICVIVELLRRAVISKLSQKSIAILARMDSRLYAGA